MRPNRSGLVTRERWYLALMGACLLLLVLAWALINRYSEAAAITMSAVALFVPPLAVIIANAGPRAAGDRPGTGSRHGLCRAAKGSRSAMRVTSR